ncbi:MAG: isoprenylcysteine carboxylmethyltransferase family protein [Phycisphaerales bacterium]|nr:isoprenylcysteine carboxylmethyltransferase family protein [Phycisphaerales bacterium]
MDTARYIAATILLMSMPPALLFWFAIHPFTRFWRRLGAGWSYVVLSVLVVAMMVGVFLVREPLLVVQFGTSYIMIALAAVCMVMTLAIALRRRKHLTTRIVIGLPELSKDREASVLMTEGIYGQIRHPRYVEVLLATLAYAFFANYLATYVLTALCVPVLHLVVILEERELRDRFGEAYREYERRVPRYMPRFGRRG